MGYYRAGFEIVGVDNQPQPHYPFKFVQADALCYAVAFGRQFDIIHASPPCQAYSWAAKRWDNNYSDLLQLTRRLLFWIGKPYIIENVIGAPMNATCILDGLQFGLGVIRKRKFEISHLISQPPRQKINRRVGFGDNDLVTVAGHGGNGSNRYSKWCDAMDIHWMSKQELTQAIPPAYTEFIGRQLLEMIRC